MNGNRLNSLHDIILKMEKEIRQVEKNVYYDK